MKITKITPIIKDLKLSSFNKTAQSVEEDMWNAILKAPKVQEKVVEIRQEVNKSVSNIVNIVTGVNESITNPISSFIKMVFNEGSVHSVEDKAYDINLASTEFSEAGAPQSKANNTIKKMLPIFYGHLVGMDENFLESVFGKNSTYTEADKRAIKGSFLGKTPVSPSFEKMDTGDAGASMMAPIFKQIYKGAAEEKYKELFPEYPKDMTPEQQQVIEAQKFQNWKNFLREIKDLKDKANKTYAQRVAILNNNTGVKTPNQQKVEESELSWIWNENTKPYNDLDNILRAIFRTESPKSQKRQGGFLQSDYKTSLFDRYRSFMECFSDPEAPNENGGLNSEYKFFLVKRLRTNKAELKRLETLPPDTPNKKEDIKGVKESIQRDSIAIVYWANVANGTVQDEQEKKNSNSSFYQDLKGEINKTAKPLLQEIKSINRQDLGDTVNKMTDLLDSIVNDTLPKNRIANYLSKKVFSEEHQKLLSKLQYGFKQTPRVLILNNFDKSAVCEEKKDNYRPSSGQYDDVNSGSYKTKQDFGNFLTKWNQDSNKYSQGELQQNDMIIKKVVVFVTTHKVDFVGYEDVSFAGGITYIDLKEKLAVDDDMIDIIVKQVCKETLPDDDKVEIRASLLDKIHSSLTGHSIANTIGIARGIIQANKENIVEINGKKFVDPKMLEASFKEATEVNQDSKMMKKENVDASDGFATYVSSDNPVQEGHIDSMREVAKAVTLTKNKTDENIDRIQDLELEINENNKEHHKAEIEKLKVLITRNRGYITKVTSSFIGKTLTILHGKSGTSKTLIPKMLAFELGLDYYELKIADSQSKWHGESGRILNEELEKISRMKNVVINLDELDNTGFVDVKESQGAADQAIIQALQAIKRFFDNDAMSVIFKRNNVIFYGSTNKLSRIVDAILQRSAKLRVDPVIKPGKMAAVLLSCVKKMKLQFALTPETEVAYDKFMNDFESLGEPVLEKAGEIILRKVGWVENPPSGDKDKINFRDFKEFVGQIWKSSETYNEHEESAKLFYSLGYLPDREDKGKGNWAELYWHHYVPWQNNGSPENNPFPDDRNIGIKLTASNLIRIAENCEHDEHEDAAEASETGAPSKVGYFVSGIDPVVSAKRKEREGLDWKKIEELENKQLPKEELEEKPAEAEADLFNTPSSEIDNKKPVFNNEGVAPDNVEKPAGGTIPTEGTSPTESTAPTEGQIASYKKEKEKQQKKNKEQLQEQQVEEGKTKVKSSTDYFYNMLKKQSALPVASSPLSVNHPTLNLGAPTPVAQTPIAPIDKTKNYTPIFSVENYQFIDVN